MRTFLFTIAIVLFAGLVQAQEQINTCRCLVPPDNSLQILATLEIGGSSSSCTCDIGKTIPNDLIPLGTYVCGWGATSSRQDCSLMAVNSPSQSATFCLCTRLQANGTLKTYRFRAARLIK